MYYWPTINQRVTLPFGSTEPPYDKGTPHYGLDLAPFPGSTGSPITLPWDALVIAKTYSNQGCGNHAVFQCSLPFDALTLDINKQPITLKANTLFIMRMCHMQEIDSAIKDVVRVQAGQKVGTIGSTGFSTGSHVHIDINVANVYYDPYPILKKAIAQPSDTPAPPVATRWVKIYNNRVFVAKVPVLDGMNIYTKVSADGSLFIDVRELG